MQSLFKGRLEGLFDRYNMGLSIDSMEWSGINKNHKRGVPLSRPRPPNLGPPSGVTPKYLELIQSPPTSVSSYGSPSLSPMYGWSVTEDEEDKEESDDHIFFPEPPPFLVQDTSSASWSIRESTVLPLRVAVEKVMLGELEVEMKPGVRPVGEVLQALERKGVTDWIMKEDVVAILEGIAMAVQGIDHEYFETKVADEEGEVSPRSALATLWKWLWRTVTHKTLVWAVDLEDSRSHGVAVTIVLTDHTPAFSALFVSQPFCLYRALILLHVRHALLEYAFRCIAEERTMQSIIRRRLRVFLDSHSHEMPLELLHRARRRLAECRGARGKGGVKRNAAAAAAAAVTGPAPPPPAAMVNGRGWVPFPVAPQGGLSLFTPPPIGTVFPLREVTERIMCGDWGTRIKPRPRSVGLILQKLDRYGSDDWIAEGDIRMLLEGINAVMHEVNVGCLRANPYQCIMPQPRLIPPPVPPPPIRPPPVFQPQFKPQQPPSQPYHQHPTRVSYGSVEPRTISPAFISPLGFAGPPLHPPPRTHQHFQPPPMFIPRQASFIPKPAAFYGGFLIDQPSRVSPVDPRLIAPPRPSITRVVEAKARPPTPERRSEPSSGAFVWAGLSIRVEEMATAVFVIDIDFTVPVIIPLPLKDRTPGGRGQIAFALPRRYPFLHSVVKQACLEWTFVCIAEERTMQSFIRRKLKAFLESYGMLMSPHLVHRVSIRISQCRGGRGRGNRNKANNNGGIINNNNNINHHHSNHSNAGVAQR